MLKFDHVGLCNVLAPLHSFETIIKLSWLSTLQTSWAYTVSNSHLELTIQWWANIHAKCNKHYCCGNIAEHMVQAYYGLDFGETVVTGSL